MIRNQLTTQEARRLFDYRDGMLYWKHNASGRRRDLRAVTFGRNKAEIKIGDLFYRARYVVWNWHHGITKSAIQPRDGDPQNIDIENLREVEGFISAQYSPITSTCPCCEQYVPVPTIGVLAARLDLTQMERRILESVWSGGGRPVSRAKIFERMYAGDPDGGPHDGRKLATLKEKISLMRRKLDGSGVSVCSAGPGAGYLLKIGNAHKEN